MNVSSYEIIQNGSLVLIQDNQLVVRMDNQTEDQVYNFTVKGKSMAGTLGRQDFVLQVNKCRYNTVKNFKTQQKVIDLNKTATVSIDPRFTLEHCVDLIKSQ